MERLGTNTHVNENPRVSFLLPLEPSNDRGLPRIRTPSVQRSVEDLAAQLNDESPPIARAVQEIAALAATVEGAGAGGAGREVLKLGGKEPFGIVGRTLYSTWWKSGCHRLEMIGTKIKTMCWTCKCQSRIGCARNLIRVLHRSGLHGGSETLDSLDKCVVLTLQSAL